MKIAKLLRFLLAPFIMYAADGAGGGGGSDPGEGGERQTDAEIKQQIDDRNNARLALYDEIADAHDESRAAEFEEIPDDAHKHFEHVDESTQDTTHTAAPATDKRTLKVNGKTLELSIEEIIERAQKIEAADDYLAEAKRIRLDALQHTQHAPKPDAAVSPVEDDLALVRAIQMGSEEEAVQAIRQLRSPTTDLPKLIDERMSFQQAVGRFQTEYQDIFSDPVLKQVALNKDAELVAQGDTRSYWDRYEAIGNEVREWVGNVRKTQAAPDKQARKASVTTIPTAASRVSSQTTEEPDESVSDVIASMARTRGQVR